MSGFGHYNRTVAELEKEIAVCCILLGLDWTDEVQVQALIDESLHCAPGQHLTLLRATDERTKARGKLFALLTLLLDITRQSIQTGVQITGSGSGLRQALNRAFAKAYNTPSGNVDSSA